MAATSKASAIDFDISRWISFDRGLLLINGWEVYSLKSICQTPELKRATHLAALDVD